MMSLGGKLTALACHFIEEVNKAEELTYLSTHVAVTVVFGCHAVCVDVAKWNSAFHIGIECRGHH